MRWYRGDCHVHSHLSDGGELTPAQVAAAARTLGLDFIAATEHNTRDNHDVWRALGDDELLVLLGQENTAGGDGHWLDVDGLTVAAHPHVPYPGGTMRMPLDRFDLVEVWNGAWRSDLWWQADNEAALAGWAASLITDVPRGRWRPAIGNSDMHKDGQLGIPHTVVQAADLSRDAVLGALRAGRSWIAGATTIDLTFTAGARLEIRGVPEGVVSLHTELGQVHEQQLPASGHGVVEVPISTAFVRAEVRHPGGDMAALTNPIVRR